MNEFVARNGLIALDSSSISGLLTLNGRLSSSNSADTTFLQGSRLVEILTTTNGQYGVRSTEAIKAQAFYLANSVGSINAFNGDNLIYFNSSNNLGIGTTNPTARLDVSGSLRVTGNSNFTSPITASAQTNADNAIVIRTTAGSNVIQLRSNGTAVFNDSVSMPYLTGPGGAIVSPISIIFGTDFVTYPSAKLHVSSSTAASVFRIDTAAGPGTLFVSGSGNVGIGTTTPLTALHVSGGAIISNGLTVTGSILTTGNVTIRGQYLFFGGPLSVTAILTDGVLNQESLVYRSGLLPTSTNISDHAFSNGQGDIAITSGTRNLVAIARGFNPSSGTGVYNFLSITGIVSQSNATGISRGIHIAPTITNAADYRAIEWTNNTGWGLYGNGSAASYLGGALAVGGTNVFATIHAQGNTLSGSAQTYIFSQPGILNPLTNLYAIRSNIIGGGAATITNAYHYSLRQSTLGSSVITNQYGYYAENMTGATNNYGFYGDVTAATGRWNLYMNGTANNYLAGNLGLGVTSPLDRLHVDLVDNQYAYFGGNNQGAGVLRGIRFGYGQSGPFYWKSAIIQEQTGDAAARGKIHILNNNQFGSNNASLSDARITILPSGEVGINNQSPVFRLDVSGSFRSSGSITATSGSDYFDISHDITQPAQTGSQVYEVNITPTLRYTAPNQTQTALRVAATFSGSTALSSSQSNIIADFGSTSAGSQLVINDTTSGSIYMVNDVSGLPIIEANSNWDVFIYDYPNVVLKKTGSTIEVSGSLRLNGSSLDTAWTSYTPQWTAPITNPVLNNGTITGAYKLIGKTCFVRVRLVIGSTTTLGSGQWYFSLPFSASIASGIQFPCSILDNGNAWYQGTVNGEYGGFTDRTAIIGQSSGSNSSQGIDGTFPIAWGNSDSLQFNGSYEIA